MAGVESRACVRIGMVGVGNVATAHLTNILRIPEADVVGLADIDPIRARAALGRASGGSSPDIPIFSTAFQMLASVQPQAVYICLPPNAHGEIELAAIEAGAHLMVQKPVGLDLCIATRIAGALARAGKIGVAGYQVRYADVLDRARLVLGNREIGLAVGTYLGGLPDLAWWRKREISGGQVIEQATHVVDLMRYLMGEAVEVYARAGTRLLHDVSGVNIADVSAATIQFASGAVGSLVNTCALTGVPGADADHGVTLIARELSAHIWIRRARVATAGQEQVFTAIRDPLFDLDSAFVHAVATGDLSLVRSPYADAIESLRLTLAIEASAEQGCPVRPAELS